MSIKNRILLILTFTYFIGCCGEDQTCNCPTEKETVAQQAPDTTHYENPLANRPRKDEELEALEALKAVIAGKFCENLPHHLFAAISYRELRFEELYRLNCEQLKVLRNVPYASHGLKFKEVDLRLLFDHCTNMGRAPARSYNEVTRRIRTIEWRNIERVQQVENYYDCSNHSIFQ